MPAVGGVPINTHPRSPASERASQQGYRVFFFLAADTRGRERERESAMAQSLELLLIQFLMPDNDARRQAEEQIKRLAKDPQVVPALVHHLRTAKSPNVRQLSAVLLRKKITGHWAKLPPHVKHSVKSALIESITLDPRSPFL